MEERHITALKKARPQLLDDLEVTPVLDHLISKGIITQYNYEKVRAEKTRYKQAECLLDIMPLKGPTAFDTFFQFIGQYQQHLQDGLQETMEGVSTDEETTPQQTKPTKAPGLSRHHQVVLRRTRDELVKRLEPEPILTGLLASLKISHEENSRISSEKTREEQVKSLLYLLARKDQITFDEFLLLLKYNQDWLHEKITTELKNVTEDDLASLDDSLVQCGMGPSREELQDRLRSKLRDYVKNDPSMILGQPEMDVYINQPIVAEKTSNNKTEQIPADNVLQLFETVSSGQRIFLYGAAGMGKSSLCRQISQSWAEGNSEFCQRFDYIFPIPMRLVRSHSLIDIICKDAGLIPVSCKATLKQKLDLFSAKVLFVLDSYEEQSHFTADIKKLIRREMYPDSSVIITARPGNLLEKEENNCTPRMTAQLGALTEQQIKQYISKFPGLTKEDQTAMQAEFGTIVLQRPINLWLLCYLVADMTAGVKVGLPNTQTELLNLILQHVLSAYAKKKKLPEFEVNAESPLKNLPGDISTMLNEAGKLCYHAVRERKHVLAVDESLLSKADLLTLGLFTEGPEENTVALPHPLFQEHLAALYLSTDNYARDALFKEIKEQSEHSSPRPRLVDVLRDLGLEHVIRFLVGLRPTVVKQLTSMVVIRQRKSVRYYHCDIQYELQLLEECTDNSLKSVIATALLDAPVVEDRVARFIITKTDSHVLLPHFTDRQRQACLNKIYNCQVHLQHGRQTLCQFRDDRDYFWDSFVVRFVCSYNCAIRMKNLNIGNSQIPVEMIMRKMAEVGELHLVCCTLVPELSMTTAPSPPSQVSSSIHTMYLDRLQGVNQLYTLTLPGTNKLTLDCCDEVLSLEGLKRAFPKLEILRFQQSTVCTTQTQFVWSSIRHLLLYLSYLQGEQGNRLSRQQAEDTLRRICPEAEVKIYRYELEDKHVNITLPMLVDVPADCSVRCIFQDGEISEDALKLLKGYIRRYGAILRDVTEGAPLKLWLLFLSHSLLLVFLEALDDGRLQTELSSALVSLGVLVDGQLVRITDSEALHQQLKDKGQLLMTEKHKDIITGNFERLTRDLQHDVVLHSLYNEFIVTLAEKEELWGPPSAENAGKLLMLLMKREDRGFYVLIEVCRGNDMPALARILEDTDRNT